MFKHLLVGVAMVALAGCEGAATVNPPTSPDDPARLAAIAAHDQYPTNVQASNELAIGAQILPNRNEIQLINYGNRPLPQSNVWVNGSFVQQVDRIPALGVMSLREDRFYSSAGDRLDKMNVHITQVQIEQGGKLYNVWGPVSQNL